MNPPAASKSSTRGSGYHQKALAEIRNSLLPFANIGGAGEVGSSAASTISTVSTTSGISSASGLSGLSGASGSAADKPDRQALGQLLAMGYSEVRTIISFSFPWINRLSHPFVPGAFRVFALSSIHLNIHSPHFSRRKMPRVANENGMNDKSDETKIKI